MKNRETESKAKYLEKWMHTLADHLDISAKSIKAEEYYKSKLVHKGLKKLKQYYVYKCLVREWYQCYWEYKEDSLGPIEDEVYKFNSTQPLLNNADCSMIQEVHKMEILLSEESKLNWKPISFLDDTMISSK